MVRKIYNFNYNLTNTSVFLYNWPYMEGKRFGIWGILDAAAETMGAAAEVAGGLITGDASSGSSASEKPKPPWGDRPVTNPQSSSVEEETRIKRGYFGEHKLPARPRASIEVGGFRYEGEGRMNTGEAWRKVSERVHRVDWKRVDELENMTDEEFVREQGLPYP